VAQGELDRMISEYYAVRGWDADGRPTAATLQGLGIDVAA
jgi:aldehyde:ferredoxin oxidoreductase